MNRSEFLISAGALTVAPAAIGDEFAAIERTTGGRLGVAALDVRTGRTLAYRASDRFPLASTFKLPLAIATYSRIDRRREQADRRVTIAAADMVPNSIVYPPNGRGVTLTVAELCAAAMTSSDNTAANALLRALGGPRRLTAFIASTGVAPFRVDRMEPILNEARPHDPRDTSTPAAMVDLVRRLLAGTLLRPASTATIAGWMRANTTGDARIRAGIPKGWLVGEKTGTSANGSNDVGFFNRPGSPAPIVLAVYSTNCTASGDAQSAAIASVARLVVARLT